MRVFINVNCADGQLVTFAKREREKEKEKVVSSEFNLRVGVILPSAFGGRRMFVANRSFG